MAKLIVAALLTGVMLIGSGCGIIVVGDWNIISHNGTWEDDFEFSGSEINVEGFNGTITVEVWDQPRIKVTAKWSAKIDNYDFQPIIEADEDSFSITVNRDDRQLGGARFVVYVPKDTSLKLRTSNGRVTVSGLALNSLDISTSNGAAMVENQGAGHLVINTSNGLARIDGWQGDVYCNTSNGAITAILGEVATGEYTFITSNGGVSLSVLPGSGYDLQANTSNGSIRNSLSGSWTPEPSGSSYSGSYNGGGAKITIRTSNSNIQILPAD